MSNAGSSSYGKVCAPFMTTPIIDSGNICMSNADSPSLNLVGASCMAASFDLCTTNSSLFGFWFVHPSWLQVFTFAPCLIQTPPWTALLVHPSWRQDWAFAPCASYKHFVVHLLEKISKLVRYSTDTCPFRIEVCVPK